jgi:osmotically-inducible protein OsmY
MLISNADNVKGGSMKTFVWLVPLLFGLNLLVASCDERDRQPATQTGPNPSTPSASKISDSDLEKAVRAKLESDAALKEAKLDIDADADKNAVTLSGTVRSQEIRDKAVELAKSAHSGLTVNDKIDVKPAA